ncbi:MAG: DUF805 domain-containing protein [Thiobacillus sp.]|nr:DUF805 domain-containing protein [Thiobacillus sp.]
MEWFTKVIKNFSFSGRARRKEYWMFFLFVFLIEIVLGVIDYALGTFSTESGIGLLGGLFALGILIQSIAVGVRRLHDTGRSGWWLLINLLPVLGSIIWLVLMVLEGEQNDNQYGPNPKRAA